MNCELCESLGLEPAMVHGVVERGQWVCDQGHTLEMTSAEIMRLRGEPMLWEESTPRQAGF